MSERHSRNRFSTWLVRVLSRLLVLVVVFIAGALAMHLGMHGDDQAHMQNLQGQVDSLEQQLIDLQAQLAGQQAQLAVASSSQQSLQQLNSELRQQLDQSEQQLAFYEQLIPPGPAGSVAIRAFYAQQQGDLLNYKILLTRNVAPDAPEFKGHIRFVAELLQAGKSVRIPLETAQLDGAKASAADPFSLHFGLFVRSSGVLQLAPGQQVQSVRAEIIKDGTVLVAQNARLVDTALP